MANNQPRVVPSRWQMTSFTPYEAERTDDDLLPAYTGATA